MVSTDFLTDALSIHCKKKVHMGALLLSLCVTGCSAQDSGVTPGAGAAEAMVTANDHPDRGTAALNTCDSEGDAAQYFGIYRIVSSDRYGGSLSSTDEATHRIGKEVQLSSEVFKSAWNKVVIVKPRYALSCHPISVKEGEVPEVVWGGHWSNFYGFGTNRKVISVLEIYNPSENSQEPDYWYEIVNDDGGLKLWNTYDGWLYKMKKFSD